MNDQDTIPRGQKRMHWLGGVVVVLALIEGGWLAFDGGRALIVGDYVTATTGEYAGKLGPWANVVSAVGIEPRSTLMKSIHVVIGVAWLGAIICFALGLPHAWSGMLVCAVLGLWYLPMGTLLSIIQIVLLCLPTLRVPTS